MNVPSVSLRLKSAIRWGRPRGDETRMQVRPSVWRGRLGRWRAALMAAGAGLVITVALVVSGAPAGAVTARAHTGAGSRPTHRGTRSCERRARDSHRSEEHT